MSALDDRLGPLSALVGTWSGAGRGVYPTIPTFDYTEEITFADGGVKPFLAYTQRTAAADDGRPLHSESGYLRWAGSVPEWVIAMPGGITEVHSGTVAMHDDGGMDLTFRTVAVAVTPLAKRVDSVERRLQLRGEVLHYELLMAAVGEPHQLHLTASFTRP